MMRSEWLQGVINCENIIKSCKEKPRKSDLLLAFYQESSDRSEEYDDGFMDCIEHYEKIGELI